MKDFSDSSLKAIGRIGCDALHQHIGGERSTKMPFENSVTGDACEWKLANSAMIAPKRLLAQVYKIKRLTVRIRNSFVTQTAPF